MDVPLDRISRASLPAVMLIDNFIEGYRETSNEVYLTELINSSTWFLNLSKGQPYLHIPKGSQNNGECDCHSEYYELDFKLLGTMSSLYAGHNLSMQKAYVAEGVLIDMIPRQLEGMTVTITSTLMKRYSLEELIKIDEDSSLKFDRNSLSPEFDVKGILKSAKCNKNVLFLLKDYTFYDESFTFEDVIATVEPYLNDCFSALFKFRDRFVQQKDTYFAAVIDGFMCTAVWQNDYFRFVDYVPLSKSPTFCELYNLIDGANTTYIRMR